MNENTSGLLKMPIPKGLTTNFSLSQAPNFGLVCVHLKAFKESLVKRDMISFGK